MIYKVSKPQVSICCCGRLLLSTQLTWTCTCAMLAWQYISFEASLFYRSRWEERSMAWNVRFCGRSLRKTWIHGQVLAYLLLAIKLPILLKWSNETKDISNTGVTPYKVTQVHLASYAHPQLKLQDGPTVCWGSKLDTPKRHHTSFIYGCDPHKQVQAKRCWLIDANSWLQRWQHNLFSVLIDYCHSVMTLSAFASL